jgi:copper chaperone CopZ
MKLEVEGMHCGSCVRRLSAALAKVPGANVRSVEIGTVDVDVDGDDAKAQVRAAIEKAGFTIAPEASS